MERKQKGRHRDKYMWGFNREGPLINGIDKDVYPTGIDTVGKMFDTISHKLVK